MEPLEITAVDDDGETVFEIAGDLDLLGAPQLIAHVAAYADGRPVVLDMARVGFLDSSGISALIELQHRSANGDRLVLVNPHEQARKVLDLTGVAQLFELR
jgi:anti-sigma B factor antagonist